MTNNKKEQKGTYISNSYAAPIVNGRIRANKVEQVDEKTKELAKLLIEAIRHLGITIIDCEINGRGDYEFYKDVKKFLNKKTIRKINKAHANGLKPFEDMLEELLK